MNVQSTSATALGKDRFLAALQPPATDIAIPDFIDGWRTDASSAPEPFLSYCRSDDANWSSELEELHEESSREHFIDVWTRRAILDGIGDLVSPGAVIADLGCSSGYLLADLHASYPDAFLVGIDLIPEGLLVAHSEVPSAALLLADTCTMPISDGAVDVVTAANLFEHVPDDVKGLAEIYRILRPGGRAVIVVPAGPRLYDYYDAYLGHERRYARRELARKARQANFNVVDDAFLGSLIYPGFWLAKKRNRMRYRDLSEQKHSALVASAIHRTQNSRLGAAACSIERKIIRSGVRPPFGVRSLVVMDKPLDSAAT